MKAYSAPTVLRTSRFRIALPHQAARTLLHHDYRNDSTASWMRSLYALHLSLSVAIPPIQPRLRLSGTNRLRSAFHGGQRLNIGGLIWPRLVGQTPCHNALDIHLNPPINLSNKLPRSKLTGYLALAC
ncbi:MAG: hypothetical protein KZQ71_14030 [Candidatus Thiodiazotropha sp. (ex Lucinoma aequizonata)]|nr:hypothetical protein [Candidatus Thiodiazotropha sp. (ex Lucinoma aequizonata)]MCU7909600.1 hypothetical protein [Candidatus Thiodiazotropha sp. (ex Lucinoma aequizonata)]